MGLEETIEQTFTTFKNIFEFDKDQIHGVVQGQLSPNTQENYIIGNYYRACGNVQTLTSLGGPRDSQAAAVGCLYPLTAILSFYMIL
jgi:hypothetical protein